MSFGFSASDFVLLVQLAHRTFRNCQNAGPEYTEISREVRSLHSVLRTLRNEAQKQDSKTFGQNAALNSELLRIANECKDVLDRLDAILGKYEGLNAGGEAGPGKKMWQKFRFGLKIEELGVIRGKIIAHTSTMSVLLDTMQLKATGRIETKLDGGFTEMTGQFEKMRREIYKMASHARASDQKSSTLSLFSLSTYTDDGKEVWQEFRRELIKKGFKSGSLDRHKHVLQAYMLKLDKSGILDQGWGSSSWSSETPWWARRTHTNTVYSWEHIHFPGSPDQEEIVTDEKRPNTGVGNAKTAITTSSPPLESKCHGNRPRGDLVQTWMFGSRITLVKHGEELEQQSIQEQVALEGNADAETPEGIGNSRSLRAVEETIQQVFQTNTPAQPSPPNLGSNRAAEARTPSNVAPSPLRVFYDDRPPSPPFFSSATLDHQSFKARNADKTPLMLKDRQRPMYLARPPLGADFIPRPVMHSLTPRSPASSDWSSIVRKQRKPSFQLQKKMRIGATVFKRVKITEESQIDTKLPPGKQGQSILKRPRESFPTNPLFPREGVAPRRYHHGIPRAARWTKVSRQLVCPEALESGRERYEAKDDCLIILRVLTSEEIEEYRSLTRLMKSKGWTLLLQYRNLDTSQPSSLHDLAPPLLRLAQARLSFGSSLPRSAHPSHQTSSTFNEGPEKVPFPSQGSQICSHCTFTTCAS